MIASGNSPIAGMRVAILSGVREYAEGHAVELTRAENGRLAVVAYNEGGCNATSVDLMDLIGWLTNGLAVDDELSG